MSGPKPLATGYIKPRILERLREAKGEPVSTSDLIFHVWTAKDLEEPIDPENAIAKAVQQLRRHGFSIKSRRGPNNPGRALISPEGA